MPGLDPVLLAVYSELEGIELVEVTSSYFQATLDKSHIGRLLENLLLTNHITRPCKGQGPVSESWCPLVGFTGGPLFLNRCTMQIT